MGAVLANVQRQAAHARRQATRAQIEAGLEKTTVRSTGADGLPVKDVEATLDGNAHGVLLGAQGKGNVEFLAAPTSARPRGSLDTQENRDAHELEQATTRLAELRGRLAGLTRDRGANDLGYMALPTVVNGQVLQGRQANPHAVQEEIKKLEARIAELRAKRAAREEPASQEAPAKDSVRLASAK